MPVSNVQLNILESIVGGGVRNHLGSGGSTSESMSLIVDETRQ
jgi:hypothetical protein